LLNAFIHQGVRGAPIAQLNFLTGTSNVSMLGFVDLTKPHLDALTAGSLYVTLRTQGKLSGEK